MSQLNVSVNNMLKALQQLGSSPLVKWFLQLLAISQSVIPAGWPTSYSVTDGERFDFVVVGAGSAGAIVAARLSEVSHWKVLLVEAGGDPPPASVTPSLFATLAHTDTDWDYRAKLDEGIGLAHPNREIFMTRGKMLGGSSSSNYEIYARGVPQDYNEWDKIAPGWNWDNVLHYFKKLEGMTDPSVFNNPKNAYLHSPYGPVLVSRPKANVLFEKANENFLDSLAEMGIKRVLENNGPEIFGASRPHFTFGNGRRSSTAEAYLRPVKHRSNLYVTKYARATRILIDSHTNKAYGVKLELRNGKMLKVYSNLEVIISAGTIDSPKILMLSGIGPKEELEKFDIDLIADLPVGKNLHDHQLVPLIYTGQRGLQTAVQNFLTVTELDSYPVPIQCGYFSLNCSICIRNKPLFQIFNLHVGATASPILFNVCKTTTNFDDSFCSSMAKANFDREIDSTQVVLLHPTSRGQVKLRSSNPTDDPVIELGYFRNKTDIALMAEGVQFMTSLVKTSHFRKVKGSVAKLKVNGCLGLKWDTNKYWRCYVKNSVTSILHPAGTCAMGPNGVVDERLRVHGVSGLRVVDASIMPNIPSGNINAPTMMIGERAADLIKNDYFDGINS